MMSKTYTVSLSRLIKEFNLETLYLPEDAGDRQIASNEVNRPGLQLAGFFELFDPLRVQIFGKTEFSYMESLSTAELEKSMETFFSHKPPLVVITRDLEPAECMIPLAQKYDVPLMRTSDNTSAFLSNLISMLNVELAPRITRHGVLVEVYGEGILLLGDSGVGKSETAIELIKRGHRLIADDAVELRRVSNKTLVGSSPANIRHFMELRGIGIINARRLFGMGSIKLTEKVDMVISMELWNPDKVYDRLGKDDEYVEILGIRVPGLTIPVKPGRNLAVIIEVAAMNNRQKKMGYNAAHELLRSLGMMSDVPEVKPDEGDVYSKYHL